MAPIIPTRTMGSTFSYDKKASLKKMALALEGLEYLVRPPPAKRDRRTSPIPTSPEQRAEAGLNLSVVSIHAIQAYAKRDQADTS